MPPPHNLLHQDRLVDRTPMRRFQTTRFKPTAAPTKPPTKEEVKQVVIVKVVKEEENEEDDDDQPGLFDWQQAEEYDYKLARSLNQKIVFG